MFRRTPIVLASLGVAVAILSAATSMVIQVATARTSEPGRAFDNQTPVNRARKGDRVIPANYDFGAAKAPFAGKSEPKLPEGCVANFNSAQNIFWEEVPGRCVAAASVRTQVG